MNEEDKKKLIYELRMKAEEISLPEAYELILKRLTGCKALDGKIVSRMSNKDRDALVNKFLHENPDIMLACVHWKVNPSPQPQSNKHPTS